MSIRNLSAQDLKNWPKTFEAMNEYLRGLWGYKDHPLSYVHCLELFPTLAAVNQATGIVGSTYISHDDEMIARGPILLDTVAVSPDIKPLGSFAQSFLVATGRRCGRKSLRSFSPMMPSRSLRPGRRATMVGLLINCCTATNLGLKMLIIWLTKLRKFSQWLFTMVRSTSGTSRSTHWCTSSSILSLRPQQLNP